MVTNVVHVDFVARTRAPFRCCRCAAPTASQGACPACVATIAAEAADSHLRNARSMVERGLCPHCALALEAKSLLALLPDSGLAYHPDCFRAERTAAE